MQGYSMFKKSLLVLPLLYICLWATNGDELIGIGAKSRAMGGTGIALDLGAENALNNPAYIRPEGKFEFLLGGTLFMPDLSFDGGDGYKKSAADLSVIPAAGFAARINENFDIGAGMFGTAGMGVDYRDDDSGSTMQMVTSLQILKFAVPLSYTTGNFRVGYTPYIQYSSLDINYKEPTLLGRYRGAGLAQDLGVGHIFGLGYRFGDSSPLNMLNGLRVGLVYKSAVKMDFKDQLRQATDLFHLLGFLGDMGETLEQPAQWGIGFSYRLHQKHTLSFDWKRILWSSAGGYDILKWSDQNVFAFGYSYSTKLWTIRTGYNHASSPVKAQNGSSPEGATVNLFNLLGFPATTQDHFSAGVEYRAQTHLRINAAFVYSPQRTTSYDTSGIDPTTVLISDRASVKHSQKSITIGINYIF